MPPLPVAVLLQILTAVQPRDRAPSAVPPTAPVTAGPRRTSCSRAAHPTDTAYRFVLGDGRSLSEHGRWMVDDDGRYALFRGVNFGSRSKRPPYLPLLPVADTVLDPDRVHAALGSARAALCELAHAGVNIVRLLVLWEGLEPHQMPDIEHASLAQLPESSQQYLRFLREIADTLYADGMYVLIDFHQDIASRRFGGDGFPPWAIAHDSQHAIPDQRTALATSMWGLRYYPIALPTRDPRLYRSVRFAMQAFWNRVPLDSSRGTGESAQAHLAKVIGLVAEYFRDDPAVLGYELLNEPNQVGLDKRMFEATLLPSFYRAAMAEVRRTDRRAFVFVEPRMDWTTFKADAREPTTLDVLSLRILHRFTYHPTTYLGVSGDDDAEERLVFAFHYYDPWLATPLPWPSMSDKPQRWRGALELAERAAQERRMVPFITEFGCSEDGGLTRRTSLRPRLYHHRLARACMDLQFQQVESGLLNAIYWNYDLYNTRSGGDNWNGENLSLVSEGTPRDWDIMARPYPMRSSAEPTKVVFDAGSEAATIILQGTPVSAPTVVAVPTDFHYHDGFQVWASGERVDWDSERDLLYWWPDGQASMNELFIAPRCSPGSPPDSGGGRSPARFRLMGIFSGADADSSALNARASATRC